MIEQHPDIPAILSYHAAPGCNDPQEDLMTDRELRIYNEAQVREIEIYKWCESQKKGYDIGSRQAAFEWIAKFSGAYHEYYLKSRRHKSC